MAVSSQPAVSGLLAGRRVWTEHDPQPIEQLKAGDRVLAPTRPPCFEQVAGLPMRRRKPASIAWLWAICGSSCRP